MRLRLILLSTLLSLPINGCGDDDLDEFDAGPTDAAPGMDAAADAAPPDAGVPGTTALLMQSFEAQLEVNRALLDPEIAGDSEAIRTATQDARASQQQALERAQQALEGATDNTQPFVRTVVSEQEAALALIDLIGMPDEEMVQVRFGELNAHTGVALDNLNLALQTQGEGLSAPGEGHVLTESELMVPEGFAAEIVANELTFPSALAVAEDGTLFMGEAGTSLGSTETSARVLRLDEGTTEMVAEGFDVPLTGLEVTDGTLFVAHGRTLTGVDLESGEQSDLVTDLPTFGDFPVGNMALGDDGMLYFALGAITNSGVVGLDNYRRGWLSETPDGSDIPCRDLTLTGENFTTGNPMTEDPSDVATTGPMLPFGTEAEEGQVIEGQDRCSGAIYRVNPDGSGLEVFAEGFRNPYGLAFFPDGRLFVTDNGPDIRGSRPLSTNDAIWQVQQNGWFGFPDFFAGIPVTDDSVTTPQGMDATAVLQEPPDLAGMPAVELQAHSAAGGLAFAPNDMFASTGTTFVAQFGDLGRRTRLSGDEAPVGHRVVRVRSRTDITPLLRSETDDEGRPFIRPLDVAFAADGSALWVIHFGDVRTLQGTDAVVSVPQTGALIRIRQP